MIIQVTLLVRKLLTLKGQQYTLTVYKYKCEISYIKKEQTMCPANNIERKSLYFNNS